MKLTRKHLVGVAAAVSTVAVAAPVSSASAAPFVAPSLTAGWGGAGWAGSWLGLPYTGIPVTGPILASGVTVVGPVIITTAPSNFNNTNNQVSAGGNWSGGQLGSG